MSNYVKQTWVDGNPSNPVSAARMGVIEQGVFDAHFQPAARAFNSANISIATATTTAITLDSERFDTDTIHDTVTNNSRLTCKTAGKYQITGNVSWAASAGGTFRAVQIRLNGATTIAAALNSPSASNSSDMAVTTLYDLAVNDYVELMVRQDSGGALNVVASGNFSPEFMMSRQA